MTCLDSEVVEWEPRLSLEAGPTGLEALQEILAGAGRWLRPGGSLVVEIAPDQSRPGRRVWPETPAWKWSACVRT